MKTLKDILHNSNEEQPPFNNNKDIITITDEFVEVEHYSQIYPNITWMYADDLRQLINDIKKEQADEN